MGPFETFSVKIILFDSLNNSEELSRHWEYRGRENMHKGKNMKTKLFGIGALLLLAHTSMAEPGGGCSSPSCYSSSTAVVAPKPVMTINHTVNSNSVISGVSIKDSINWDGLMKGYPGAEFFKRFQFLPGIQNLQFIPGPHILDEKQTDDKVVTSTRQSALIARVGVVQSPFSLMFKVEEKLRRCANSVISPESESGREPELNQWVPEEISDAYSGKTGECMKRASLKLTGPIAIYGTMPGSYTDRLLMLNLITLDWSIANDSAFKNTEIRSSFTIDRPDFPKAINKIVDWAQGSTLVKQAIAENPQQLTLLQVGRVLNAKNKQILQGL